MSDLSNKKSVSDFLKRVTARYPLIEFEGMKFRIRRAAPHDADVAHAMLMDDEHRVLGSSAHSKEPMSDELVAKWTKEVESVGEDFAVRFNLYNVKTVGDYRRIMFQTNYQTPYIYANLLMDEEGSPMPRESIFDIAKVIVTEPKFKKMIVDALVSMNVEETNQGQEVPNDLTPLQETPESSVDGEI